MNKQVGSLNKAFLTNAAQVGPLPCVHSHVGIQAVFFTEVFLANGADVGLLTGTHFDMSALLVAMLPR